MKCVIFWLVQCRGSGFQHPLGQPSQLSLSHSVSAGPTPECQKPSEKCSFFPQGYSRFFKEKEVTALAAVIFILQLTEPSSKEVSGILFKFFFFFFFSQKACASHTGCYVCCTDHPDPRHLSASIIPHSILSRRREGIQPLQALPASYGALATGRAAPVGNTGSSC